jgi:hypothetical protein
MKSSTRTKSNVCKAVCSLLGVAVLIGGCRIGRALIQLEDISFKERSAVLPVNPQGSRDGNR